MGLSYTVFWKSTYYDNATYNNMPVLHHIRVCGTVTSSTLYWGRGVRITMAMEHKNLRRGGGGQRAVQNTKSPN